MESTHKRHIPWKLIVISGASGTGKSTVLNLLYEKYGDQVQGLRNLTTRTKRDNDEPLLEYVSKSVPLDERNTWKFLRYAEG
jgi:guanylate kinase